MGDTSSRARSTVNDQRANNFDLVRLVAAAQVVLWHGIEHLKLDAPPLLQWLLGSFSGVPIFFVVSGYLVAGSLARSTSLSSYFRNRALRIFPGLWVCFAMTFISIAYFRGVGDAGARELLLWTLANLGGFS